MTPMVDLAFLLLTFFILTTTMYKPSTLQIVFPVPPEKDQPPPDPTKLDNAITLILTKKDMYTYTLMIYNVRAYFVPHISDAQFAVVVGTIPILLVFILFSRSFMSGIMTGAVKG